MAVTRKLAGRGILAALLTGLAVPAAAQAATADLPSPAAGRHPVVHVTQGDDNKTYHVDPGTRIDLDLRGSYDPPSIDHPSVLREDRHSGGYPTRSDARAVFTAIGTGAATISSQFDAPCMHTTPHCEIATIAFRVNFLVDDTGPVPGARTLSEPADHHTITVRRGQSLTVLLHSTYWTISDPRGGALTAQGPQVTEQAVGTCVPGAGCGTAMRSFRATTRGIARLQATRTSCGEALRCTGGHGKFDVTLLVVR